MFNLRSLRIETLLEGPCDCAACQQYAQAPCTCGPDAIPCLVCQRYHGTDTAARRCAVCAVRLTDRFAWCAACRQDRNAAQRALYVHRRAEGLCVVCATPVGRKRAYCVACLRSHTVQWAKGSASRAARINACKARQVCPAPACGVSVAGTGKVYCTAHRVARAGKKAAIKAERAAALMAATAAPTTRRLP